MIRATTCRKMLMRYVIIVIYNIRFILFIIILLSVSIFSPWVAVSYTHLESIIEDKTGKIWIATQYGLSRFSPDTETFENFFFSASMQDVYKRQVYDFGGFPIL